MGSCLSKKGTNSSSPIPLPDPHPPVQITSKPDPEKPKTEDETVKKEIFVIKHRKSHDRRSDEEKPTENPEFSKNTTSTNLTNGGSGNGGGIVVATPVRTSSCTKEEVDAILIQCGRLSRSSSMGKAVSGGSGDNSSTPQRGKRYSGSKRSFDFDNEGRDNRYDDTVGDDDEGAAERIHRHRQRHRQARAAGSSSSPHGRRRTPSRERDQQQQRSGSRERAAGGGGGGGGGGGRRVSRSPGRRSESPISGTTTAPPSANNSTGRPGKMVSVPATVTVSSMAMDKSNNGGVEGLAGGGVKRIQVKRNVGEVAAAGCRTAASPRSRSPAGTNIKASNENQPLTLSRSNSRKAEHSPYRRNPLSEIDNNASGFEQTAPHGNKAPMKKPNAENVQVTDTKSINRGNLDNNGAATVNFIAKENQMVEETKGMQPMAGNVAVNVVGLTGLENPKPQTLTRSRSSRKSRDLDINPESLLNPTPSYAALLLEDIHNFHQKNTLSFSLPACVTKANSILEAVADLNSTTSSNLSSAFTEDKRRNPTIDQFISNEENSSTRGKKRVEAKDPIMESELIVNDDLMEPSFHKYVTVRRGPMGAGDMDEQESSGSNSYVGGPQHWLSSSWEPNSADSTDCWTSSRSNTREDDKSHGGSQRNGLSDKKKRESDNQHNGIGRGRVGTGRGLYTMPGTAAAST
ncbi:hypothetical protein LguiA_013818 [Lonicera macranthoides]